LSCKIRFTAHGKEKRRTKLWQKITITFQQVFTDRGKENMSIIKSDPVLLFHCFTVSAWRTAISSLCLYRIRCCYALKIEDSESFSNAVQQYRRSQANRNMIFDSRIKEDKQEVTRQSKYETVSVIPKCFGKERSV